MIRNAGLKDIPGMLGIYSEYVLSTCVTFEYEPPTPEEFQARVWQTQQQYPWLVCEKEGKLVGYAYATQPFKRAAYQWNAELAIYLDISCQRQGTATAFYKCLEEILLHQGYYNLCAVVSSINAKSVAFVKSLGFNQVGHYKNAGFKQGCWLDVFWFAKPIKTLCSSPAIPVSYKNLDESFINSVFAKSNA